MIKKIVSALKTTVMFAGIGLLVWIFIGGWIARLIRIVVIPVMNAG